MENRSRQTTVNCLDCHVECGPETPCPCCQAIARDRAEFGGEK